MTPGGAQPPDRVDSAILMALIAIMGSCAIGALTTLVRAL